DHCHYPERSIFIAADTTVHGVLDGSSNFRPLETYSVCFPHGVCDLGEHPSVRRPCVQVSGNGNRVRINSCPHRLHSAPRNKRVRGIWAVRRSYNHLPTSRANHLDVADLPWVPLLDRRVNIRFKVIGHQDTRLGGQQVYNGLLRFGLPFTEDGGIEEIYLYFDITIHWDCVHPKEPRGVHRNVLHPPQEILLLPLSPRATRQGRHSYHVHPLQVHGINFPLGLRNRVHYTRVGRDRSYVLGASNTRFVSTEGSG